MADYEVKVGITTEGDPSGAQQVDVAIKQVGETAKTVAQETGQAAQTAAQQAGDVAKDAAGNMSGLADALGEAGDAAPGVNELDGAMNGLKDALATLSPEKAKGAVGGLTKAIMDLASGDTGKGLEGLGRSLFSLANLIPLPGAAPALIATVGLMAGAWKLLRADTEETERTVNELGLTVDEEMARLESWANSQIDWNNIKEANASLREDFRLVNETADSTQKAIEDLFATQMESKINALRDQAAAAKSGGDEGRAADLNAQAESLKLYQELVKTNVTLTASKADLAALQAQSAAAAENFKAIDKATQDSATRLEELNRKIVERTGSMDAAVDGEKRAALTKQLDEEGSLLNMGREDYLRRQESAKGGRAYVTPDDWGLSELAARRFANELRNYVEISKDAEEKEKIKADAALSSSAQAAQTSTEWVNLGLKIEALQIKARDLETALGPDVAAKAFDQAGKITGAMGDMLESVGQLSVDNAEAIKAAAEKAIGGAKESIGLLGEEVKGSSEAAAEVIGEGQKKIQESIEGTAAEAGAAGDTIKAGAEEFRGKIGDASVALNTGISSLVDSSLQTLKMISGLAIAQAEIARQVSAVKADVGLSLSQIRNLRQ